MVDYTKREQVALLRDFLNVVGTETEGVEVRITQDDDNGMRFYSDADVLLEVHNNTARSSTRARRFTSAARIQAASRWS